MNELWKVYCLVETLPVFPVSPPSSPLLSHLPSRCPAPFRSFCPPPTSDLTKTLCTVPHNEVCFFHMLMLLLTAQCAAQGEKQSRTDGRQGGTDKQHCRNGRSHSQCRWTATESLDCGGGLYIVQWRGRKRIKMVAFEKPNCDTAPQKRL